MSAPVDLPEGGLQNMRGKRVAEGGEPSGMGHGGGSEVLSSEQVGEDWVYRRESTGKET